MSQSKALEMMGVICQIPEMVNFQKYLILGYSQPHDFGIVALVAGSGNLLQKLRDYHYESQGGAAFLGVW